MRSLTLSQVSDDSLRIGRVEAPPETINSRARTIYVKGFGYDNPELTIDLVLSIFAQFGEVAYVRVRRTEEKKARGSVFVEFATEEAAQAALAGKDSVRYKGEPFDMVS
jgi:lupus La protein